MDDVRSMARRTVLKGALGASSLALTGPAAQANLSILEHLEPCGTAIHDVTSTMLAENTSTITFPYPVNRSASDYLGTTNHSIIIQNGGSFGVADGDLILTFNPAAINASFRDGRSFPPGTRLWLYLTRGTTDARLDALEARSCQTITPADFGAKGDNMTDDTLAVRQACSFAIMTGVALDGKGLTYRVTGTLDLPVGLFVARYIKIDGSDIPLNGLNTTTIMSMQCSMPALAATLTANADQSAISVLTSGVTGLSADDWVLIRSEDVMAESENNDHRKARACELVQVRSVEGAVINFWSALQGAYSISANARVEKVQTQGRVSFEAVEFIGCERGFYISEGFGSSYRRVSARDQPVMCIFEDRCYFTDADKWFFEGKASTPSFVEAPYGINYSGCYNCNYGDVMGWRTRHIVTTGSAGTPKGRSVSRGCTIGAVLAFECFSSPVDQHPGGGFIQVGKVKCTWAPNASNGGAVQLQGAGGQIEAIENYGHGQTTGECSDIRFDSFGFADPNFDPTIMVGAIKSRNANRSIVIINNTNRNGNSVSQTLVVQVAMLDTITNEDCLSLYARSGGFDVKLGSGFVVARNGNVISISASDSHKAFLFASGVHFKALGAESVCQIEDGAFVSLVGGWLESAPGASAGVVRGGSRLDLTSVREVNVALRLDAADGSTINRVGTPA